MKKFLIPNVAVLLALMSGLALAAVLNFTWTNPTQNTDGSAIPATGAGSLTATSVEYGPCNAGRTALASVTSTVITAAPGTSAAANSVPPGVWCARAKSTNTYGVDSDWTPVVSVDKAAPKPNPPSNFSAG